MSWSRGRRDTLADDVLVPGKKLDPSIFCARDIESSRCFQSTIDNAIELHSCVHERFSSVNGIAYCKLNPMGTYCRSTGDASPCRLNTDGIDYYKIKGWSDRLNNPLETKGLVHTPIRCGNCPDLQDCMTSFLYCTRTGDVLSIKLIPKRKDEVTPNRDNLLGYDKTTNCNQCLHQPACIDHFEFCAFAGQPTSWTLAESLETFGGQTILEVFL